MDLSIYSSPLERFIVYHLIEVLNRQPQLSSAT